MAEHDVIGEQGYESHTSIMTLVWMWSQAHHAQWVIVEAMRVEPDVRDDGLIDLDYRIEEIDSVLRQLEPLIGV